MVMVSGSSPSRRRFSQPSALYPPGGWPCRPDTAGLVSAKGSVSLPFCWPTLLGTSLN